METNKIKNWKVAYQGVDCQTALNVLQNQIFAIPHEDPFVGPFAISSPVGRIFTEYSPNLTLKPNEIIGDWTILIPDTDRESKNKKLIRLAKESNATGLKHCRLEHMSIEEIWEYITDRFNDDIKYRMLKWYFENKVYLKTLSTSKDKKKVIREDTGFVDAFGNHIYEGDIFVYKKYLPFKDPFGKTLVPDDIISNWDAYRNIVCLHPVFFDEDKQCWASDVYGDADPLLSYDTNQIIVVTNIVDHPKLYNH